MPHNRIESLRIHHHVRYDTGLVLTRTVEAQDGDTEMDGSAGDGGKDSGLLELDSPLWASIHGRVIPETIIKTSAKASVFLIDG